MTCSFNRLFVSYQPLYSRGSFSPLLGVNAVVWSNHTIVQMNSSCLCFSQRAEAFDLIHAWEKWHPSCTKVYFGNKGRTLIKKPNKSLPPLPSKWGHVVWLPGPSAAVHKSVIFLKGNAKWYYVVIYFHMHLGLSSTVIISTAVLKTGFWLK